MYKAGFLGFLLLFAQHSAAFGEQSQRTVRGGQQSIAQARFQTVSDSSQGSVSGIEAVVLKVRGLLTVGQFDELNRLLHNLQASVEGEITLEEDLLAAYDAFQIKDPVYESFFKAWVEATPNAYQARLGRAKFYYRMGWVARGGKWASETKEEQFAKMNSYFDMALTDVVSSLASNGHSTVAYSLLVDIARSQGRDDEAMLVLGKALEAVPASYIVRRSYLRSLEPRWGGSFEEMQAFAQDAMEHVKQNPKLQLLNGMVYAEAGSIKYFDKAYSVAERFYDKALEFGESHAAYFGRGKSRYGQERYKEALADFDRAGGLNPNEADHYYWRSKTHAKLQEYAKSAAEIEMALRLDPTDEYSIDQRDSLVAKFTRQGYELRRERKPTAALEKFNMALRLSPDIADLYQRRARARIDLNQYDAALPDLKRAIELDPNDFASYHLLDWILAKRRDWDQIIRYWDRYIALNPDNSRAYVERGGAYYHKGDLRAAVADAKAAADMGNLEGKEAYERFGSLVK